MRKSDGTTWKYTDVGWPRRISGNRTAAINTGGTFIKSRHCARDYQTKKDRCNTMY